jgi:hypothetical protein
MHDVAMRESLERLAEHDGGRRLLQLALRSIERGDHELVSGCWTRKCDAGCLFQHAYWQGVEEGVFADEGRPGDWIGSYVGTGDYGIVIRAIEAFDVLAKTHHSEIRQRRVLPDRVDVRQDEWRTVVETMLVDALATSTTPVTVKEVAAAP